MGFHSLKLVNYLRTETIWTEAGSSEYTTDADLNMNWLFSYTIIIFDASYIWEQPLKRGYNIVLIFALFPFYILIYMF